MKTKPLSSRPVRTRRILPFPLTDRTDCCRTAANRSTDTTMLSPWMSIQKRSIFAACHHAFPPRAAWRL